MQHGNQSDPVKRSSGHAVAPNPQWFSISLRIKDNVPTIPHKAPQDLTSPCLLWPYLLLLPPGYSYSAPGVCPYPRASALEVPMAWQTCPPDISSPPALVFSNITFSVRPKLARPKIAASLHSYPLSSSIFLFRPYHHPTYILFSPTRLGLL